MSITVTCPCGTRLRVEAATVGDTVRCGHCGAFIPMQPTENIPHERTPVESGAGDTVFASQEVPPGQSPPPPLPTAARPDLDFEINGIHGTVAGSANSQETCVFQTPISEDSLAGPEAGQDSFFVLQSDSQTTALLSVHGRRGENAANGETQVSPIHISLDMDLEPPRTIPVEQSSSGRSSKAGEIDLTRRITPTASPMEGLPEVSITAQYGINRIIRPHAKGGMGLIQIAYDQFLKREVALKELRPEVVGDETVVQRFIGEAEITAQLEHPGIVPIHHLGLDANGNPYYTMKLIKGITLQDAIKAHHATPDPQGLTRLVRRLVSVCQTVSFAHENGVIHRDLKPANIMLSEHGETIVMDWGLAKSYKTILQLDSLDTRTDDPSPDRRTELESVDLTVLGAVVGTPAFMSPEQASPDGANVGPVSDIYSLGAILYVLLTGQPAYSARTTQDVLEKVRRGSPQKPSTIKKTVPAGLEAICLKAMAREIPDRYQNAQELMQDLCHWLDKEPISAFSATPIQRLLFAARKHKRLTWWLAALGGVLLFVLLFVAGLRFVTPHRESLTGREILSGNPDLVEHPLIRRQLIHASEGAVMRSGVQSLRGRDTAFLMLELGAGEQAGILFLPPLHDGTWDLRQRRELQLNVLQLTRGKTGITDMSIRLGLGPHYFEYRIQPDTWKQTRPEWVALDVPLAGSARFPRSEFNLPDLGEIGWIEVRFQCDAKTTLYLNGVKFQPSLVDQ